MDKVRKLVVFNLDERQFAVHLSNVERILPSMEMKTLPLAPDYILGTINLHGEFLPVISVRKIFQLPERDIKVNDHLIITANTNIRVALSVDSVKQVVERNDQEISKSGSVLLDSEYVDGLFKLGDGIVLIHDLNMFLTPEQVALIREALVKVEGKGQKAKGGIKKKLVK